MKNILHAKKISTLQYVLFILLVFQVDHCLMAAAAPLEANATKWQEEEEQPQEEDEETEDENGVVGNVVIGRFGMGGQSKEFVIAAKRFTLKQAFAMYLTDLEKICELDEQQKKKLQVGAKGAIKKALSEWREGFDEQFDQRMGLGLRGLVPNREADDSELEDEGKSSEDTEEIVVTNFDDIDQMTLQFMNVGNMRGDFTQQVEPTEQTFWSQLVRSTLTEKQRETYAEHRTSRENAFYDSLHAYFVSKVARELMLDQDQADQFSELLKANTDRSKLSGYIYAEPDLMLLFQASQIDSERMDALFSDQQRQKWKLMYSRVSHLEQLIDLEVDD